MRAIAVEDLDFAGEKTREKHGRRKKFRQLICGMPIGRLRARLTSMAYQTGIAIVAVDPAYTSKWGAQHGSSRSRPRIVRPPGTMRRASRSGDAPKGTRSGDGRHRPLPTGAMSRGIGPPRPDRAPAGVREPANLPRTAERCAPPGGPSWTNAGTSASNTVRDARSTGPWVQDSLLDTA